MKPRKLLDGDDATLTLEYEHAAPVTSFGWSGESTPTGAHLSGVANTGAGARILAAAFSAYADELDRVNASLREKTER